MSSTAWVQACLADDVTPEDVKAVGPDVLRHRLVLTYEADAEEVTAEQVVRRVFEVVEVP